MKCNLPIKVDNTFLDKIKRFFYKLLKKDTLNNVSQTIEIEKRTDIAKEVEAADNIKTVSAPSQIDMMRKERENAKLKDRNERLLEYCNLSETDMALLQTDLKAKKTFNAFSRMLSDMNVGREYMKLIP